MSSTTDPSPSAPPTELCGYPVTRQLTEGQSYLASGPGGRPVVLKRVDEDCLLRGTLHPNVRDRLSRIRELAHGGVANLHGAAREGEAAYLIWEYVEGATLDDHLAASERTPRDLLLIARELILGVDSLHLQGIVHGALIGSNVIVTRDGSLRLTHISPLLYTDMAVDVESVISLLEWAVERCGAQDSPLGRLVEEAAREQMPLRALGARVGALLESRDPPGEPEPGREETQIRRRTLLGALLVTLAGLAVAYGVWRFTDGSPDLRGSFHWLQNVAPDK